MAGGCTRAFPVPAALCLNYMYLRAALHSAELYIYTVVCTGAQRGRDPKGFNDLVPGQIMFAEKKIYIDCRGFRFYDLRAGLLSSDGRKFRSARTRLMVPVITRAPIRERTDSLGQSLYDCVQFGLFYPFTFITVCSCYSGDSEVLITPLLYP